MVTTYFIQPLCFFKLQLLRQEQPKQQLQRIRGIKSLGSCHHPTILFRCLVKRVTWRMRNL